MAHNIFSWCIWYTCRHFRRLTQVWTHWMSRRVWCIAIYLRISTIEECLNGTCNNGLHSTWNRRGHTSFLKRRPLVQDWMSMSLTNPNRIQKFQIHCFPIQPIPVDCLVSQDWISKRLSKWKGLSDSSWRKHQHNGTWRTGRSMHKVVQTHQSQAIPAQYHLPILIIHIAATTTFLTYQSQDWSV